MAWHPDRNPENKPHAEEKFREATEAYSVLSDQPKREAYDRFGHAGISGVGFEGGFNTSIFEDFQDIFGDFFGFEDLFGGGGARRGCNRAQRGYALRGKARRDRMAVRRATCTSSSRSRSILSSSGAARTCSAPFPSA